MTSAVRSRTAAVDGVSLELLEAGPEDGPVVVLAHGFPESSWSWRHQLPVLADAGWHVIAPDQRGYGRSSRPPEVSDYGSQHLSADLVGLLDDVGQEQAVFVGHDWGALILWDLVRLHPTRVRAAVGVSVPFVEWPAPPTAVFRQAYGDRFFYILYFQAVGPAEKELEADPRETLRQVLWSGSASDVERPARDLPAEGTQFLDAAAGIEWPSPLPPWLTEADLNRYTEAFEASGFFGPLSYYRNLDANHERVKDVPASVISMPTYFIAGDQDLVIRFDPGGIDRMARTLPDFRGSVLLPDVGHWTQQEAPEAFNQALLAFLTAL